MLLLMLAGCPAFTEIGEDQPCLEVGYALAHVAESCGGDRSLGNARYEAFVEQYQCIPSSEAVAEGHAPQDLYDCAFAISEMPCAVAEAYGDALAQYLEISPGCALVVEARP